MIQMKNMAKPQTKHQKKQIMREKIKKVGKMKKRIMKLLRNQQMQFMAAQQAEESKIAGGEVNNKAIDTDKSGLQGILNKINSVKETETVTEEIPVVQNGHAKGQNGASNGKVATVVKVTQNSKEEQVVEITQQKQKKKKNRKRKAEIPEAKGDRKKVVFELEKNKTKEFYMFGKVGLDEIPKSKLKLAVTPGIIKKTIFNKSMIKKAKK